MNNPTMLYKHPGKHKIHGDSFDYVIVDESEVDAKLKEGWAKSTDDAKGSSRVEKTEDTNQVDDIDSDGNGRVTKKEIAAKLKELGVEFDSRSSKADLEDLLNKSL